MSVFEYENGYWLQEISEAFNNNVIFFNALHHIFVLNNFSTE